MEALLVKSDMWTYVTGDKSKPAVTGEGSARMESQRRYDGDAWIAEDRKVKSDLILAISLSELK